MTMAAGEPVGAELGQRQPPCSVDFGRPLVCVLGLPFDAIDLEQAVQRIRAAAFAGQRCFVSTSNLNFAMTARVDAAFRGAVLRSDLNLADGMPLVWTARLLGLPLTQRVSGADVFEALRAHGGPPITVFLFGGPPGVAERARGAINRGGSGMRCVGFDDAGFGTVESMSGDDRIDRINRSGAQFVIASLGAGKGQAWLERNAGRLTAPVLSHLGAVLNFAAGSVRRAPRWMIASGLEWLWRVKEEPSLWRRYWHDGACALGLLMTSVMPEAIAAWRARGRDTQAAAPARLEVSHLPRRHVLRLSGDWRSDGGVEALRLALTKSAAEWGASLQVDLAGVTGLGNASIALLLVARGWFDAHGGLDVTGASPVLTASLRRGLVADALLGGAR
ncbi:MAG: WecB/TagA/CpsF family glycosyltransferase [Rhizobacter sp.]|nr:WecB/TagA/CpsF family glycosyltransferase [Rhizobacter sp.]